MTTSAPVVGKSAKVEERETATVDKRPVPKPVRQVSTADGLNDSWVSFS